MVDPATATGLVTGVLGTGLLDTGVMVPVVAGAGAGMVVEGAAVGVVVIEHNAESAVATGGD